MKFDLSRLQSAMASESASEHIRLGKEQLAIMEKILKAVKDADAAALEMNNWQVANDVQELLLPDALRIEGEILDCCSNITEIV